MAFGIPGSESSNSGDFLPRLQFDARVGMWKRVERVQGNDGWSSVEEDLTNPQFVVDFRSLEVGYAKLSSPPAFLMVSYGQPFPPQPEELGDGKRKAYQPGFRARLLLAPKRGLHSLTNTSKTMLNAMDDLHQQFLRAREAEAGQIPVVAVTGRTAIEVKTPEGKSKFYAPQFSITGWVDRPEAFGPATVPVPSAMGAKPAAAEPVAKPANHVPPPTPKPAPEPAMATADDDLPF